MRYSRVVEAVIVALLLVIPHTAQAQDDLDGLLTKFAQMPGLSADFREVQHIALLTQPLTHEGTVHFAPPSRLARHTLKPARSSFVLDASTLTVGDAHGRREVDLAAHPVAAELTGSLLHILAGDRPSLEKAYRVEFSVAMDDEWTLTLTPRSPTLTKVIERMTFKGRGLNVSAMTLFEASGDRREMVFVGVRTDRRYSPTEIERVFRIGGP